MKIYSWITILSTILLLSGTALLNGCSEAKALNVNEVASDPGAYQGDITLVGVTKAFARNDQEVFGIIDLKELQCTSPNCNMAVIPVKYSGSRPVLGDEVRVTGRFSAVPGGYLFTAAELKVVRRHQIGG